MSKCYYFNNLKLLMLFHILFITLGLRNPTYILHLQCFSVATILDKTSLCYSARQKFPLEGKKIFLTTLL